MKHSFIFNGKSSLDYGIIIATHPESRHAERRGSTSTIPGRHGALYRDEAAFSTYEISYDVLLDARNVGDMYHLGRDLSAWLLTASGYYRLEDTYEPEHYRMARYVGSPDVANILFKFGRAELEFEVQPQRYLKSGEQEITLTEAQQTIYNPTAFAAAPLIRMDIDASQYPEPEEAKEITEVELTWTLNMSIGNRNMRSDYVHRVYPVAGGTSQVSQQIDVEGYEKAVITTQCWRVVQYPGMRDTYFGDYNGTCYTFLDADGNPTTGVYDTQKMINAEVAIPKSAKWLVINTAYHYSSNPYPVTPSVTLYPAPSSDEKPWNLTINGVSATVTFTDRSTIFLDCDAHDAYYADGSNANAAVSFREIGNAYATFPELDPGENLITINGTGVTASIVPRWWTL